ncbi:hypothetical protein [Yoonia sp. 208BN28-4]|uniref:hypothetical protein n=1 Tax=Yoonia sp. 208BN28-4 TaxID=3126505 RepID=UPI0030B155EB
MFHRFSLTASFLVAATALPAQTDRASELFDVLELGTVLEIMRDEGLGYGQELGEEMFPERVNADWTALVARIYDLDTMIGEVERDFTQSLEGDDVDAMIAFFNEKPGSNFVDLEISARRALMDDAVEEASQDAAAIAMADETDRYRLVQDFVEANSLVDSNVVGALNANYAFYTGLIDGGALGGDLTEDQILSDVWGQEPEIRQNTTEWIYSFLLMAYEPMSDEDLQAYIAFSQTPAGQQLNEALFEGFDDVFEEISRALGLAASQFMIGAEL